MFGGTLGNAIALDNDDVHLVVVPVIDFEDGLIALPAEESFRLTVLGLDIRLGLVGTVASPGQAYVIGSFDV
jgi:hypothetical protein